MDSIPEVPEANKLNFLRNVILMIIYRFGEMQREYKTKDITGLRFAKGE